MSEKAEPVSRLPAWLRRPPATVDEARVVKKLLRSARLNTVCEQARCPNICECFQRGTATFLIMGDVCTRSCLFCSIQTGKPALQEVDFDDEAERVAHAASRLGLKHVVVTSVTRDDLADGGASAFVRVVHALRRRVPGITVEVLIPDFGGCQASLKSVVEAGPDVLNHNLETVKRLYMSIRPEASYERSLELLARAKALRSDLVTKTGVMLGLGESESEVVELMDDSRRCGVDIFTAGQYMQPTPAQVPVANYLSPEQFEVYRLEARRCGFPKVFVGPLVRSSYHAEELVS